VTAGVRLPARFVAFAAALAIVGCAGCSTPKTASGNLDQGKQRVDQLVLDAAHSLPATSKFHPPTEVGTQPCRRTFAGYVIGRTGAHRAEVPLIVYPPANAIASKWFPAIEAAWTKSGYQINRSRINQTRFPQISASTPDGDTVTATAFDPTPFGAVTPQIDLYAVSQCLNGD
jgi:hypothetical protein